MAHATHFVEITSPPQDCFAVLGDHIKPIILPWEQQLLEAVVGIEEYSFPGVH